MIFMISNEEKCNTVFQNIYDSYAGDSQSIYGAIAWEKYRIFVAITAMYKQDRNTKYLRGEHDRNRATK